MDFKNAKAGRLLRVNFSIFAILVAACISRVSAAAESSLVGGSADARDWMHFNPSKFQQPERLVPSYSLLPSNASMYLKGAPGFPHDPSRLNVIYGRGPDSLPTEIYAKAFDILQISNKYFQSPAAGESKHIVVDGTSITIYGTSPYTPLPNNSFVGNPVQISPFDPSRIFYKDKDM